MIRFKHLAAVFMVAAAALTSGCATIVKGSTQDLMVNTDPSGASCDLSRGGSVIATVNPTPGSIQIKKDKNDIEVKCKKNGYAETSGRIPANFEGWTVGNILFGGIIGIAVDYSSGALNSYEPELFVKLTPEKFASSEDKADFYEKWRSDVLQNSTKAKIAASKTCVKEQCDEISRRIDKETEQALAAIESNRNLRSSPAPSIPSPSPSPSQPQVQVARTTEQIALAPANTVPAWMPRIGDRWKYRLIDGKRSVGTVVVEIIDARGQTVTERITRDDERGFVAERGVDVEFNPIRYQDVVTLPGGFQLAEISPYAPAGVDLKLGQQWANIPVSLLLGWHGKKKFLMQAKVVRQEMVSVPAGEFNTMLMEAVGRENFGSATVKITSKYWYAPQLMRTVKTSLLIEHSVSVYNGNAETYELVAFEPAK